MKDFYKIGEISRLYGIGADSLRYYEELGILRPRRDVNGYRMYSIQDVSRLNIIRDLRQLGFSMGRIKEYLDHQTVASTLDLLQEEQQLVGRQIEALSALQQNLSRRADTLRQSQALSPDGIRRVFLPQRKCLKLSENVCRDAEVDFLIKKLQKRHEDKLYILGNNAIGASVSPEGVEKGIYNLFDAVFFILPDETEDFDFVLQAGEFLTLTYRGGYHHSLRLIPQLLEEAGRRGLRAATSPIEIYRIDNHETANPEEYLTEIQLGVE